MTVELSKEDFNMLIVGAVRYAIGRQTYVVQETVDLVLRHRDSITRGRCQIIVRSIREEEKRSRLGGRPDTYRWTRLAEALEQPPRPSDPVEAALDDIAFS